MIFGAEPLTLLYAIVGVILVGLTVMFWLYARKPARVGEADAELRALRAEIATQRARVDWLQGQAVKQSNAIDELRRENAQLRAEVAALRAENAELHAVNGHLSRTMETKRQARRKAPATLRQVLTERLNDDELRTLCLDLGIDYDDLAGEGHGARVTALVAYAERHCRVDDLLDWLRRTRPEVEV